MGNQALTILRKATIKQEIKAGMTEEHVAVGDTRR